MSGSNRSWCRVCGKEYEVCHTCASVKTYTPWRTICDTPQHFKIWVIVDQYKKGIVSKTEAKKMLQRSRIKVSDAAGLLPAVRDIILEILQRASIEADKESKPA